MENKNNVQFHYLADRAQPLRVLTLATQKVSDYLFRVAYAVNHLEVAFNAYTSAKLGGGMISSHLDQEIVYEPFNKAKARTVALGRLETNKNVVMVNVPKTDVVRFSVLKALYHNNDIPPQVRKIAKQILKENAAL